MRPSVSFGVQTHIPNARGRNVGKRFFLKAFHPGNEHSRIPVLILPNGVGKGRDWRSISRSVLHRNLPCVYRIFLHPVVIIHAMALLKFKYNRLGSCQLMLLVV